MVYVCTQCRHQAFSRQQLQKHIYQHVPQDAWPYRCPIMMCHWYGRYSYEYKVHSVTKRHVAFKEAHEDIDDSKAVKNTMEKAINVNDWIRNLDETPSPQHEPQRIFNSSPPNVFNLSDDLAISSGESSQSVTEKKKEKKLKLKKLKSKKPPALKLAGINYREIQAARKIKNKKFAHMCTTTPVMKRHVVPGLKKPSTISKISSPAESSPSKSAFSVPASPASVSVPPASTSTTPGTIPVQLSVRCTPTNSGALSTLCGTLVLDESPSLTSVGRKSITPAPLPHSPEGTLSGIEVEVRKATI